MRSLRIFSVSRFARRNRKLTVFHSRLAANRREAIRSISRRITTRDAGVVACQLRLTIVHVRTSSHVESLHQRGACRDIVGSDSGTHNVLSSARRGESSRERSAHSRDCGWKARAN